MSNQCSVVTQAVEVGEVTDTHRVNARLDSWTFSECWDSKSENIATNRSAEDTAHARSIPPHLGSTECLSPRKSAR